MAKVVHHIQSRLSSRAEQACVTQCDKFIQLIISCSLFYTDAKVYGAHVVVYTYNISGINAHKVNLATYNCQKFNNKMLSLKCLKVRLHYTISSYISGPAVETSPQAVSKSYIHLQG